LRDRIHCMGADGYQGARRSAAPSRIRPATSKAPPHRSNTAERAGTQWAAQARQPPRARHAAHEKAHQPDVTTER